MDTSTLTGPGHTPNAGLPPLDPFAPKRKMLIEIEVAHDFEKRLDNQWMVEREIHADRWNWRWADTVADKSVDAVAECEKRNRQISEQIANLPSRIVDELARRASAPGVVQPSDTDRLNWLIAHGAYLSHSRDGDMCNVWFSYDPDDDSNGAVPVEGYPQKSYHDARAAIDAAMRHTSPKKGDQS